MSTGEKEEGKSARWFLPGPWAIQVYDPTGQENSRTNTTDQFPNRGGPNGGLRRCSNDRRPGACTVVSYVARPADISRRPLPGALTNLSAEPSENVGSMYTGIPARGYVKPIFLVRGLSESPITRTKAAFQLWGRVQGTDRRNR